MTFSDDISDLLFLLYKHEVEYLIVGGEAAIFYGVARFTGDIDIFYDDSDDNSRKLFGAINEFWDYDIPDIKNHKELITSHVVQFGFPPNRIDLLKEIDGISFQTCWTNKMQTHYEYKNNTFVIYYIGLDDLIRNKKASGRNKDLDDLDFLTKQLTEDKN